MAARFLMLTLDPEKIEETIAQLQRRVNERFPDSGLSKVCGQLLTIGRNARERSREIARPNLALRTLIAALIVVILTGIVATAMRLNVPMKVDDFVDFVQLIESGLNDIVLIGAAIFFLTTLEIRFKRRRALAAIHELRAIAHIIDMHQLTKDPERVLSPERDTSSSPKRSLSPFELGRYLDYCSEMLAIVGKLAAVYVQQFDDSVVLDAANEVEELSTGLSQKIWQKINLIQQMKE
ncbi:MAG TPA: hypothetical protein VL096_16570 [Pirellulaceae bacterium]|nr:hypothetical protein [Pirellulaceae bacterium]